MEEKLKEVQLEDFKLFYEVYGNGNNAILCFHGNGRSAEDFRFLATEERKIISIHLFLHHYSTFSPERIETGEITPLHVEKLLEKILENENVDTFHWVAYSQGGRFTLCAFPYFAHRVKSMYLIAPDGMNNYSFYSWTQRQWWARMLFKRWVQKPNELMSISKFLMKFRLIHPKVIDFLEFYADNPERLKIGYQSWSSFRNLKPSNTEIRHALQYNHIKFEIIIGQYDQIISKKSARKFLKKVKNQDALKLLPFGHNIFKPEIQEELFRLLEFDMKK
ncbi:MAG: alpha/beta hydrolase [Brumimicrobium sp.]|nr:alpha/beta hydrolase [Brumimicrobium sp.]MCO5269156.1 alpha/beta hydrolase [Brumimicrobium sp.]